MTANALTGNDTLTLFGRVFNDFADANSITLTYPNELVSVKTGKKGNSLYAINETGRQSDIELRLVRGSADHKFLNSQKLAMEDDIASFTTASGEYVKRVGDGSGSVTREIYTLAGGVFSQGLDAIENVEGDTEQAVVVYRLKFARTTLTIA